MKSLCGAVTAALMFATPVAMAATLPLADLSCKQFVDYNKDNTSIILTWLDGYYSDKNDPAVIGFDRMGQNGKNLEEYCSANPDTSVSKAAEKVMGK